MIRRLLQWLARWFDACDHDEMIRERRNGVLYLVCMDCGYAEPMIKRVR